MKRIKQGKQSMSTSRRFNVVVVLGALSLSVCSCRPPDEVRFQDQEMSMADSGRAEEMRPGVDAAPDMPTRFDMMPDEEPDVSVSCGDEVCEGETPRCDRERDVCVPCIEASDCRQDLAHVTARCEQSACVYACTDPTMFTVRSGEELEASGCDCEVLPEVCDGEDNDCDGEIDEEIGPLTCERSVGVCAGAELTCEGDASLFNPQSCSEELYMMLAEQAGAIYEADELEAFRCDGEDNDCDGEVDESCCEPSEGSQFTQVASSSTGRRPVLIGASASSAHGGVYMVAYHTQDTVHLVELDEELNIVARGEQTFAQSEIGTFDLVVSPTSEYLLSVNVRQATSADHRYATKNIRFYTIPPTKLTPAGATNILSGLVVYQPYSGDTISTSSAIKMMVHGASIYMVYAFGREEFLFDDDTGKDIYTQTRSLKYCSIEWSDWGSTTNDCARFDRLWANELPGTYLIKEDAFYNLDTAQRGENLLLMALPEDGAVTDSVTVRHIDIVDFNPYHTYTMEHINSTNFLHRVFTQGLLGWIDEDKFWAGYGLVETIEPPSGVILSEKAHTYVEQFNTSTLPRFRDVTPFNGNDRLLCGALLSVQSREVTYPDALMVCEHEPFSANAPSYGAYWRTQNQGALKSNILSGGSSRRLRILPRLLDAADRVIALIPSDAQGALRLTQLNVEGDRICSP